MIAIIDYGAGNLRSVQKAFEYIGADAIVTSDKKDILTADRVVLPGVGAFGDCVEALRKDGLDECIYEVTDKGTPFLGICLGLQMLFETSEETPEATGLGIFKGKNIRIPDSPGLKIPHMGWNSIELCKESKILENNSFVYFVHSYYLNTDEENLVSAYTEYGERLAIAVERDNVFATQFHPEKSGDVGMEILRKFIALGEKS